jgi:alpha-beta hydrolase superfamily lysophospholipase
MQVKTKRRLWLIVKTIPVIYILGGLALWYLQDSIFLHPIQLRAGYVFKFKQPHEELNIPIAENRILNIVKFFPIDTSDVAGVVLYFHGNRENINRYADCADYFTRNGYEVWMPDYPGFGKSTGKFREEHLYNDATLLYKLVSKRFAAEEIVIYGRSLGTGVATELASRQPCKQLILETPYYSLPELAGAHFPFYPTQSMLRFDFPLYQFLPQVKAPVTIFHGTNDGVIPYKHSLRLKPLLKKGDEYITLQKGRHNNLAVFSLFHEKIDSLLLK